MRRCPYCTKRGTDVRVDSTCKQVWPAPALHTTCPRENTPIVVRFLKRAKCRQGCPAHDAHPLFPPAPVRLRTHYIWYRSSKKQPPQINSKHVHKGIRNSYTRVGHEGGRTAGSQGNAPRCLGPTATRAARTRTQQTQGQSTSALVRKTVSLRHLRTCVQPNEMKCAQTPIRCLCAPHPARPTVFTYW